MRYILLIGLCVALAYGVARLAGEHYALEVTHVVAL